jgi:hypothetical protein
VTSQIFDCLYFTLELNWPSALYMPRNLENTDVHACNDRPLDISLPVVRGRKLSTTIPQLYLKIENPISISYKLGPR